MTVNLNTGVKPDFQPIGKEKGAKGAESNGKTVSASKCGTDTKCINIKDDLSINSIPPGGCVKPGWDPTGGLEDLFAIDKQVSTAKKQVKTILNTDSKAEIANAVKDFYQNIDTMDRSELLEVAQFLNEMIASNPKQADVLTGLMNGVLQELKQKEDTWHKLPWGPLPCGPGPRPGVIFEKFPLDLDLKKPAAEPKSPLDIKPKFDYPPGDYPIKRKEDFMFAKN